jgi:NAD(P)H-flavin reductase
MTSTAATRAGVGDDALRRTLAPLGRRRARVTEARQVGAYRLFACADPGGPAPRPGQFYMLAAAERWGGGEGERPFLPRAFSYLRRRDGELQFLLEDVGPGTRRLGELEIGEDLWIAGPLGIGFAKPGPGRRPLLVGGGIGIVPLACWQDELGPGARALLGFRDAAHAEAAGLLREPALATDDGSAGRRGLVTGLLRDELASGDPWAVYACGPPAMLEAVRAIAAERGVPAQLAMESGMACGFGACFGCVVPTRRGYVRLCVDGPVVDAADLETALIPGTGH